MKKNKMKYSENFCIRTPILPLDCTFVDINYDVPEYLSEKYINRMKYRTSEFGGFSYVEYNNENLKYGEIIAKKLISSKNIGDPKYMINPFLEDNGKYYSLDNEYETIVIYKNKYLNELLKNIKINNFEKILKEELEELIELNIILNSNDIIKWEKIQILTPTYFKYNDYKIFNRTFNGNINEIKNKYNKQLYNIEKIIHIIHELYKYENLDELNSYFIDKYGENMVPVKVILKDEIFLNKLKRVKILINYENELYKKIKNKIIFNNESKEIKLHNYRLETKRKFSVDLYMNWLVIDDKNVICVDTNHRIQSICSANFGTEFFSNSIKLGYYFDDDKKNLFYEEDKNLFFVNKYSNEKKLNFDKIYVNFDKLERRYELVSENKVIKFIKPTQLNLDYFPEKMKFLYLLSDLNNLTLPSTLDVRSIENLYHFPRIIIDDVIFLKETWIIDNDILELTENSNFEIFKLNFKKYVNKYKVNSKITISEDDYNILVDINDEKDIYFIYKKLLKKNYLILKEEIQQYSFMNKKNKKYANDVIMSFSNELEEKIVDKSVSKKTIKHLPFEKWLFIEIKIKNFVIDNIDILINLDNFCSKYKIDYFYVNYKHEEFNTIRFRMKNNYDFKVFKYLNKISYIEYIIKFYYPEINKYKIYSIEKYENFFCLQSKIIVQMLSKIGDQFKLEIFLCLANILLLDNYKLHDDELLIFFSNYKIKFKVDQKTNFKDIEILEKKFSKFNEFLDYKKISFETKKIQKYKEIKNHLHMLCNRIFGVNEIEELKALKILKNMMLERIYKK